MESYCPRSWERGNKESLVQRAHLTCFTEDLLKTELNHTQKVFFEINDFPLWVMKQIFAEVYQKNKQQNVEENDISIINTESGNKRHLLVLPYQGEQGSRLVTKLLPETTQVEFRFTDSKHIKHFQIKEKMIFEHNRDVVYLAACRENNCSDNYVGENTCHVSERIIDHRFKDQNSHLFKHSCIKKTWKTSKSVSLANLARSLYSLLTTDKRNSFLNDTKFWFACPDILMPSRMVWMISDFSSLWSPFVFKMLGSWESNFIKQPVIFDMLRWTSCVL